MPLRCSLLVLRSPGFYQDGAALRLWTTIVGLVERPVVLQPWLFARNQRNQDNQP